MVTKNYARFLNGFHSMTYSGYITAKYIIRDVSGDYKVLSLSGNDDYINTTEIYRCVNAIFAVPNLQDATINGTTYGTGMFLGAGATSATTNDYSLESLISFSDSGLSLISETVNTATDRDTLLTYVLTVKNNSTSPITISESGIITNTIIGKMDEHKLTFLWARDTFESVTLQPGETRAFTMTIGLE